MHSFIKTVTMASVGAIMAIAVSANAQSAPTCKGHQGDNCVDQGAPDNPPLKRYQQDQGDQDYQGNQSNDQQMNPRQKQAQGDWQYDPNKHRRRHHRDNDFRFEFGGYWYPQPYWLYDDGYGLYGGYGAFAPTYGYGLSCRDGRSVVRERGFYRVRTIECNGRIYTYVGQKHGDVFQVQVSARSGRIVNVRPMYY